MQESRLPLNAEVFGGEKQAACLSWQEINQRSLAELESTPVRILLWGAGPTSPAYKKRMSIKEHLTQVQGWNDVRTSEELIQSDPRFAELHEYDAERLQVQDADLVVAVVPSDPQVTGVHGELLLFDNEPGFHEKAILIWPKKLNPSRDSIQAFVHKSLSRFSSDHIFQYSSVDFKNCTRIRKFCEEKAAQFRARKYMKLRQQQFRDLI